MAVTGKASHTVRTSPTQKDYARYVAYVTRRVAGNARWHYFVSLVVSIIMARLIGDWLVAHEWMFDTPEMYIGFYLILNIVILRVITPRFTENYVADDLHWTKPKDIELTAKGFRVKSDHTRTDIEWQAVNEIDDVQGLIVFFIDRTMGFVIPRNSFEKDEDANAFVQAARDYHAALKTDKEKAA